MHKKKYNLYGGWVIPSMINYKWARRFCVCCLGYVQKILIMITDP